LKFSNRIALQALYPEEKIQAPGEAYGYWTNTNHQREFFERLAPKYGIVQPQDWNKVNRQDILKEKGGNFIISYYNSSVTKGKYSAGIMEDCSKTVEPRFNCIVKNTMQLKYSREWLTFANISIALRSLYPEHKEHFKTPHHSSWKDVKSQRVLFDVLAAKFNIQKPEDWYNVTAKMALKAGAAFINTYYNGSLLKGNYSILYSNFCKHCEPYILSITGLPIAASSLAMTRRSKAPNLKYQWQRC
jgi:hypothetical protein